MGSCIICGKAVDGRICSSHEEDVVFEFRGTAPDQLTPRRFYRGTVDGYADFGVFIDLGDRVTGLLHRSELDSRLESLDWEVGEEVFVQVKNVRDNGDVDLGWSIRQSEREFRGALVEDPDDGEFEPEAPADEAAADHERDVDTTDTADTGDAGPETDEDAAHDAEREPTEADAEDEPTPDSRNDGAERPPADESGESTAAAGGADASTDAGRDEEAPASPTERTPIETLRETVGESVRIEGEIVSARQTSGPTVFEVRDETATVDCAAFVEAGVRAYPDVEVGSIVRLEGEVRTRREELQVETDALAILEDDQRATVEERMAAALTSRAEPDELEPLVADDALDVESLRDVATAVRRAVLSSRPVVVRHPATADGYVGGAAIERATLPLIEEAHAAGDATYHYFDRRPLEGSVYDMDDATNDLTSMLGDRERHDEQFPLFVFVGAGTTRDSHDGLSLLDVYGVRRVVVSGDDVDEAVRGAADVVATPAEPRTATTLAANAAVGIDPDVRADLRHLPAVSYWGEAPADYDRLAREAGFDEVATRRLREAVALEAFYQTYEDKRQLIIDLLFEETGVGGLAEQVSEQFRGKLGTEVETAEANLDRRQVNGTDVAVLDTEAFTHRFDFPPAPLLLDELHRRHGEDVTVGIDEDELRLRGADVRTVAGRTREAVPTAGITVRGERLEFLSGARERVLDAVVDAVSDAG